MGVAQETTEREQAGTEEHPSKRREIGDTLAGSLPLSEPLELERKEETVFGDSPSVTPNIIPTSARADDSETIKESKREQDQLRDLDNNATFTPSLPPGWEQHASAGTG